MGPGRKTTHRAREIVRLGVGFTPFCTRNSVRRRPIRSDDIRLIFCISEVIHGTLLYSVTYWYDSGYGIRR